MNTIISKGMFIFLLPFHICLSIWKYLDFLCVYICSVLYLFVTSWLVICVFRVACDFVSRLGGRDTNLFLKERLVETFLGGPRFWGCGAKATTWIPSPSVVAHVRRLSGACRWVQAQARTPPSNQLHEMATWCRLHNHWLTCTRRFSLHSSFFGNVACSYVVGLHNS